MEGCLIGKKQNNSHRHHYVPRVYLKEFSYNPTADFPHLYFYDKLAEWGNDVSLANVGLENNYNLVDNQEDTLYYERYYAEEIEKKFGQYIREIKSNLVVKKDYRPLSSPGLKAGMSWMIAFQLLRVTKTRDLMRVKANEVTSKLFSLLRDDAALSEHPVTRDFLARHPENILYDNEFKNIIVPYSTSTDRVRKFARMLYLMDWHFRYNNCSIPFVTSDNPVIVFNALSGRMGIGNVALLDPNTQIAFPLTSKILIYLAHPPLDKIENELETLYPINDIRLIKGMNFLQWLHCKRQIYAKRALEPDIYTP